DVEFGTVDSSYHQRAVLCRFHIRKSTMSTNTAEHSVQLHRVLKSTADRVFRAFITPGAFAKWLPPHGFIGTVHEMDGRVGGRYRMSFTNFTTGHSHGFGGEYLELEP